MSLDESLSKLISSDEASPVDVAMMLLNKDHAVMTTNLKNPAVMTALKVYVTHYGDPSPENKSYSPKSAAVMEALYKFNLLHNISHKGWRAEQIVKIFTGLQLFFGMGTPQQQQEKGGLLGRKK